MSQYGYFSVVVEEPAIMLKLHSMSQYGSYHISVILGVISTNHHTHYFSAPCLSMVPTIFLSS